MTQARPCHDALVACQNGPIDKADRAPIGDHAVLPAVPLKQALDGVRAPVQAKITVLSGAEVKLLDSRYTARRGPAESAVRLDHDPRIQPQIICPVFGFAGGKQRHTRFCGVRCRAELGFDRLEALAITNLLMMKQCVMHVRGRACE